MTRLESFFLASGLVLTTATQLRISGLPIGPGEVLCLIWLLLQVPTLIRERGSLWADTAIRGFVLFWGVMFFAIAAGSIKGLAHPAWDAQRSAHDAFAYGFASLVSIAALSRLRGHTAEAKHLLFLVLLIALSLNIVLWLVAKSQLGTMSAALMYSPTRFQGLANNPNQLALLMVGLPFWGWYFLENSVNKLVKLVSVMAMGAAMFIGLQTGSDALKLGALFGMGVLAITSVHSTLYRKAGWQWRIAALGVVLGAYVLFFTIETPVSLDQNHTIATTGGPALNHKIETPASLTENIAAEKGVRFALWTHAIQAWAEAPIFGFGPGAWSGITAPFEGVEAHNSFLDIGMSAGIVGLLVYLGVLYWLSLHFLNNRCYALLTALGVMVLYSLFHYVLRHPFVWVVLATSFCVCAGNKDMVNSGVSKKLGRMDK